MINHMIRDHIIQMFSNEELEFSEPEIKAYCDMLEDMAIIEKIQDGDNIYDIAKTLDIKINQAFINRVLFLKENRTTEVVVSYDGEKYIKNTLTLLLENHMKQLLKLCYNRTHNKHK